jgi:hypothetical protein
MTSGILSSPTGLVRDRLQSPAMSAVFERAPHGRSLKVASDEPLARRANRRDAIGLRMLGRETHPCPTIVEEEETT